MLFIEINHFDRSLYIGYRIESEPQVWTLPNGDPGTPGYEELIIESVDYNGREYLPTLKKADQKGLLCIKDLEDKIIEKIT